MTYDRFAPFYDAVYEAVDYEGDARWLQQAWDRHSKVPVQRVLDLGCGSGNHAARLAAAGFEVEGMDLSEPLLVIARAKLPGATFHLGDMSRELPPDRFDAAISMFGAWCYLLEDEDCARLLRLLRDRLPAGATFAFETWSPYGWRPAPRWESFDLPDGRRLLRFTDPRLDNADDVYRFSFEHLVVRGDALEERFVEEHALRMRTPRQTRELVEREGFEVVAMTKGAREGKSFEPPGPDEFRVMVVARRA